MATNCRRSQHKNGLMATENVFPGKGKEKREN